jgi:hypothetical protein
MSPVEIQDHGSVPTILGLARLARVIYHGEDRGAIVASLASRISANAEDAAALMDLSTIVQLTGEREKGLAIQAVALDIARVYRCVHGSGSGLRVLALCAPGDFMANTPLDFLLDESDTTVYYAHVMAALPLPDPLPDHDIVFVCAAESDENKYLLARLADAVATWPCPVINRQAHRIAEMTRDRMWQLFRFVPEIMAPRNVRVPREDLLRVADGSASLTLLLPDDHFPIIARPVDSHAGNGLVRIGDTHELHDYLRGADCPEFYIASFVDYSSADGRFRKYRIVFIAGRPYLAHLAISTEWMVHYLNAGMHESADRRAEEARCMEGFDEDFAARHSVALGAVARLLGLDYFAIDCAETRDGRLLLFEAGTGMIVHAMDSADVFPYKQIQMQKIFRVFGDMLEKTVNC